MHLLRKSNDMTSNKSYLSSIFLTLSLLLTTTTFGESLAEGTVTVITFSEKNLNDWENKSFSGETHYSLKEENQKPYLHATSSQSASALYKKVKININDTPYLNWSWRIGQALPELDEQTKKGDDYAARIYVVFKTGYTPLSAKALNYVWSSNNDPDAHWPNAYTEKAIMIPLRSNQDETNHWKTEKVNIKEDLMKHFDKTPKYIDAIAIMTDTDNSEGTASASYGDIYFSTH